MSLTRTFAIVLLPTLTFGAVVLTGSVDPLRAAGRAAPKASLSGVMVSSVVDAADPDMPQLAFQGTQHPTRLALVVDDPSGGIVGFDRDASSVESFADSTGRSLLDPESPFSPFGFAERILDGGSRIALELDGALTPADDAAWIEARGEVAVNIAHEKGTWTSERTPMTARTKITCGPYTFEVLRSEPSRWGEGHEFELRTKDPVQHVIAWALVDGTERHELQRSSTMSFNGTSQITLQCEDGATAGSLEIEAWKNPRAVRVPFSLKARVGQID